MIEARDLRRTFNGHRAVDGVSFAVERGEVFGFLGPNGAGKSTTIRMLTGQLLPSGGSARVAGFDCAHDVAALKPLIGVVFEQQNLYERMSGRENLVFFTRLFGVPARRADAVLEQVRLGDRAKDPVKVYSNGMRQRLLIARSLLHQPPVLFLDEPTHGLDPTAARDIRRLVADLGRTGTSVFLTTHYMEEADQLCHRVAFLNAGRIVAMDAPSTLKLAHGRRAARVVLKDSDGHPGEELILRLDTQADAARLGDCIRDGQVLTIHSAEATLEDIFIELAGRGLNDGGGG